VQSPSTCSKIIVARTHKLHTLSIFSHYTSPLNPLVGIDHLKLGKIYPHLNEFQTAIHHIREAGDVLKLTHGDQSRMMRDFVRPLLRETQIMLEESQKINLPPVDDEDEEEEGEEGAVQ
jgi:hypothetical protein